MREADHCLLDQSSPEKLLPAADGNEHRDTQLDIIQRVSLIIECQPLIGGSP